MVYRLTMHVQPVDEHLKVKQNRQFQHHVTSFKHLEIVRIFEVDDARYLKLPLVIVIAMFLDCTYNIR